MKLVLQLVLLNFVFCASAHREHDNIPALRSDNDHTRSGLLDKLEHSLLGKPVHNHKKRKIVDHTRIGKDGKVYHAKHYVKGLLHEDSVIEDLPHRCNDESHPKIEQIHSYYSLSDKQKREWDQNGKTEPERRRRLSDDTIAANGVIRPMKLILIPQGSPDCGETCVNSTTWAKAIYLRETIMPRLQSKLAEIFTVTTWRNSIITDGGIASDTPCVWDASNTFSNPKYNSDFPDEEGDYYLMYDMFAFTNPFTVAAAGNCYTINADKRPVIGTAVFAPNYFGPEFNLESQVHTAVHETFHALGFNDNVIGEVTGGLGRETQRETTRFYVTSEYATEFARDHFSCSTLLGAEIENDGGTGTELSHIEERTFGDSIMTGWVNRRDSRMSGAELAIMKDLKWYTVNMTAKQPLFWGKNQGCNFGYLPCIDKATGVSISEPHFPQLIPGEVAPQTIVGSSAARLGCTIGRYFKALAFQYVGTSDVSPTYQQYFADTREFGNGEVLLEYCPYYSYYDALQYVAGETSDSLNCSSNHVPLGGNSRKELYGVDSRCLITKDGAHNMPSCYPVKCYRAMVNDTEQTVFAIKPLGSDDYTQCDFAGQIVTPAGTELEIFCPSSGEVCVNATMAIKFVQPSSSPPRYGPDGDLCPAGFSLSADVCSPCPVGTFSTVPGRTMCFDCAAGTYSVRTGATECALCPENTYSMTEKASKCMFCAAGYGSTSGSMSCTKCPAGTFSPGGGVPCSPCVPGSYAAMEGMSFCLPCAAGTESAAAGSTSCSSCSA